MPKVARPLQTSRWQKLRARVLADEPLCRSCQRPATEVDHIQPRSKGGALWDRENLQALCSACHSRKTSREAADLPTVCIHGWRSDLAEKCPDCAAEARQRKRENA